VSINQSGSYVLSGILTVPDADTDAIVINADHVTIDLNGFAILGPTDCSGGLNPCAGAGSGDGISTALQQHLNITVRNGTIQGMGREGIRLDGDSHLVEYVHVRSNGRFGIFVSGEGGSIVQHNMVQRNGGTGMVIFAGIVTHNVVDNNNGAIRMDGGTFSQNLVTRNAGPLLLGATTNYIGNVLINNSVNGGKNQGQNLCGVIACGGAQF
jgi:hypothetical protein